MNKKNVSIILHFKLHFKCIAYISSNTIRKSILKLKFFLFVIVHQIVNDSSYSNEAKKRAIYILKINKSINVFFYFIYLFLDGIL